MKAILVSSLISAAAAYPSSWLQQGNDTLTAFVVPRAKLTADCVQQADGAHTCVSPSEDVTTIYHNCDGPNPINKLMEQRNDACTEIHCRQDKKMEYQTANKKCGTYTLTLTMDGSYPSQSWRDAYYEIIDGTLNSVKKEVDTGSSGNCENNPAHPPDLIKWCTTTIPQNIQVSTFGGSQSGSTMDQTFSLVESGDNFLCEVLVGAVNQAAGAISPGASAILGKIQGICG